MWLARGGSLWCNHVEYFVVYERIATDSIAAKDCRFAGPTSKLATGFFDDGLNRSKIPWVGDRIDHRFG